MVVRPIVPFSRPKPLSNVPELTLLEAPVMLNLDNVSRFRLFRHFFPDWIDVGPIKIAGAIPAPTPNLMWTGHKVNRFTLLFREQTVVRAKP